MIIPHSEDVGIMAEAKALLADIVEVWWSPSSANLIRAGKLSASDIKAAYLIRDHLLDRASQPSVEREKVVAWLRAKAETLETTRALAALRWADAIERGEHLTALATPREK